METNNTTTWQAEYTDTFGGEANYCWVRRAEFQLPSNASQAAIMRAAKAALSLTGAKGRTHNMGEGYEFRPSGSCTVLFVTPQY